MLLEQRGHAGNTSVHNNQLPQFIRSLERMIGKSIRHREILIASIPQGTLPLSHDKKRHFREKVAYSKSELCFHKIEITSWS